MSAILSSFMGRNSKSSSKRKGKKYTLNLAVHKAQSPPSPGSFMSPEIVDINEKVFAPPPVGRSLPPPDEPGSYDSKYDENSLPRSNPLMTPQLKLDMYSEPGPDLFSHDTTIAGLREALGVSYDRLNGSGSLISSGRGAEGTRSREAFGSEDAVSQPDETAGHLDAVSTEDLRRHSVRKPAPAPIRIPNTAIHGPKVQLQRSAHMDSLDIITPTPNTTKSHPDSPLSTENMSATSGTTLARALIANSFILSSDVRTSRHRSGYSTTGTRQDSATLPRGEHPFLNSPYWRDKRISGGDIILTPVSGRSSIVPPVPRIPSSSSLRVRRSRSARNSAAASEIREKGHRQSGADLSRRASSSSLRLSALELVSPLTRSSSLSGAAASERPASRRISRIVEVPSPAPSTPGTPYRGGNRSPNNVNRSSAGSSPLANPNHSSGKTPSSEYSMSIYSPNLRSSPPQQQSHSDTSLSPNSRQSMSTVNGLDDYVFMSPARSDRSAPSPMAPESSASITAPVPYRRASKRALKKRKSGKMMYKTNSSSVAAGKGRVDLVQRRESDAHRHLSSQDNSKVKLLPIGERPGSLLVPQTPLTPASIPTSGSPLRLTPGIRVRVSSSPPSDTSNTRFFSDLESPESPDVLDGMLPPISRGIFARQRSGSTPDPISIVRDYRNISQFNITVGPERGSPKNGTPSTGSGHQTFPETPNAFSPIWSASTAGGSPDASAPSLSAASSLPFTPSHFTRSTSLSGTKQASQPNLAQKVMLFRTATVTGDQPSTGTSKLQTVTEVTDPPQPRAALPTPVSPPSSLNKQPSAEMLSEHVDTVTVTARRKPLPPNPQMTPASPLLPVGDANSQSLSVRSVSRPLPNIAEVSHSPSLSTHSVSPRSVSPLHGPSPLSARRPLPDQTLNQNISSFSPSPRPVSPATARSTEGSAPLALPNLPPTPSPTQSAGPSEPRRLPETETEPSFPPSFIAPPPYQAVVDSQTNGHLSNPTPIVSRQGSDAGTQTGNGQASAVPQTPNTNLSTSASQSSTGRAPRPRPPLPGGPRKPMAGQLNSSGSLAALRERNGSVSSIGSNTMNGGAGGSHSWRKLVAQCSSPKFQIPAPKFRGYTLEAAQWTFTSHELQAIVSRAIKQSAQASSVRLLRLETLDIDIPAEMHRLEMQKMDLKNRYKVLARKRWTLLGSLTAHVDGLQEADSAIALLALEELTEVSSILDHLAEELHGVTEQLAHLKSLGDVHSASALAMALRKLNASFLKQVAENQTLRQHVSTMEAERDEGWKQAQDIAHDYDGLIDRWGELSSFKSPSSRRSSQVSAVRKSSIIASRAGLRSASLRRSQRSSVGSSGHRGSMSIPSSSAIDVPPVPPMPHQTSLGVSTPELSSRSSMTASYSSPPTGTRDMLKAQEDLYNLLGISVDDTKGHGSRPRSVAGPTIPGPTRHSRHPSLNIKSPYARPVSEIGTPGFRTPSMPGSARFNRFYIGTDDNNAILTTTMDVISR